MEIKKYFFFSFFLCICLSFFGQIQPRYSLIAETQKKAIFINIDKLGQVYACDGTTLEKYDADGNFAHAYSALSFGEISFVDVTNPFKIMIFSKNFAKLLFLDTKLASQQSAYILSDLTIMPTCVCVSHDNGLWVYDKSVKQLFRYDAQYNLQNKSQILANLVEDDIDPLFIKETDDGFLLVNDRQNGILVFDRFGTYLKLIPVFTDYFQVLNRQIMYVEDNLLKFINIQNIQQGAMSLPEEGIKQLCLGTKKMIILDKDNRVKFYTME